jgi:hypothetical protein
MRIRAIADVDSSGLLSQPLHFALPPFQVDLEVDLWGVFRSLRLEADCEELGVPDPEELRENGSPPRLPGNPQASALHETITESVWYGRILEVLQYLESMGSLLLRVERVDWKRPRIVWGSKAESGDFNEVFSWKNTEKYNMPPLPVAQEVVGDIFNRFAVLKPLMLPLSFFREGYNYYFETRYVQSFVHFYFYIEYLYGDGKSSKRKVLEAFGRSQELRGMVEDLWAETAEDPWDSKHQGILREALAKDRLALSFEGIMEYMYELRNRLSHASPNRANVDYTRQGDYRTPACVLSAICLRSASRRYLQVPEGTSIDAARQSRLPEHQRTSSKA